MRLYYVCEVCGLVVDEEGSGPEAAMVKVMCESCASELGIKSERISLGGFLYN